MSLHPRTLRLATLLLACASAGLQAQPAAGERRAAVVRAWDIEAGPLFNQGEAERRCPALCTPGRWTGQWRTTQPGRMSVCGCSAAGDKPAPILSVPPAAAGPVPIDDARLGDLLGAMKAESFGHAGLAILESAARENHFTIDQLRRIVPVFSFPSDRIRAVELVAPRVLDRRNAFSLYSVFEFEMERQQARAIFERLK